MKDANTVAEELNAEELLLVAISSRGDKRKFQGASLVEIRASDEISTGNEALRVSQPKKRAEQGRLEAAT
ncbi:hypothetical protein NL676_006586 [Syzygium grande]|nr:hypothetical protein NL676_006586 [Syzygium grande]